MPQIEQSAVRNRLLAALAPEDFAALAPALRPVQLGFKETLHEPDRPVQAAYFPEAGMVSMLAPLEDGKFLEVGLVGREGMVGLPIVLGDGSMTTEALVQMEGTALSVRPAELRAAFERNAGLRTLLLRYVLAHHVQVAQSAACNGHHQADGRLARWLLMCHDRAGADEFPMTQEFLSLMLGSRRPTISVAAAALRRAGAIEYTHGRMRVLDRVGLEAAACECYGVVREQYDNLLGVPAGE